MNNIIMQDRNGQPAQRSFRGFTLVELLVIIAMVALLIATLLPTRADTRQSNGRIACARNLRQLAMATLTYTSEYDDYMPALKSRGGQNDLNVQFPFEMFRYNPVNVSPPTFQSDGGPYNLGLLWSSGLLSDGHMYYCPTHESSGDSVTFSYYNVKTNWPLGTDPINANPGYVRAGYYYYPQSKVLVTGYTDLHIPASVRNPAIPFWPDSSTSPAPYNAWLCVPPFKLSEIDPNRSMVTEPCFFGLSGLFHKTPTGLPVGMNAAFGDGHVVWEAISANPNAFYKPEWDAVSSGGTDHANDVRYILSVLKP